MSENPGVARLVPDEPLPPYAYVPRSGLPHPTADPGGHRFGARTTPPPGFDPSRWDECRSYLVGIDLFNHGFFWEAHEAWEGLWHASGRHGATADLLKGLIKLAAAGVKHREGVPSAMKTHALRASVLWRGMTEEPGGDEGRPLGFRLRDLISLAESIGRDGWPAATVRLVPSRTEGPTGSADPA